MLVGPKDGEPCELCQCPPPGNWFCASCGVVFCDKCWDMQIQHKRGRQGLRGPVHEKSNLAIAKRLEDILTPTSDPEKQKQLHISDFDTTWFDVDRNTTASHKLQLRDYGRFIRLLHDSFTGEWNERWPQLVAFVGETGDGKSTLVKMLIDRMLRDMEESSQNKYPTPVVGAAGNNTPTSGGVHLYADPGSFFQQFPRFYADCEGLRAGETVPIGDRSKILSLQENSKATTDGEHRRNPSKKSWDIRWADRPDRKRREFLVSHLYPRFLYTFSNVIVFVLKNQRAFETAALITLLDWASQSIEKSLNQPALPHAIIAFNACEGLAADSDWDVGSSTNKLLSLLDESLENNPALSPYIDHWKQNGKIITSTVELIKCYYSSFSVVCIPGKGRYMRMDDQIRKLNHEIVSCCIKSHKGRTKSRLDLNDDEMADCLQSGFAHFSQSLSEPFDFVARSWNLNPIPPGFAGNILRLAIAIKDSGETTSGPRIFENLSAIVASCVFLDFVRHRIKGTAKQLLTLYKPSLDSALKVFCEEYWPCSYRDGKRSCANYSKGHTKGHQDSSGKIFGTGNYQSGFTSDSYLDKWHLQLFERMERLRRKVERKSLKVDGISEKEAVSRYHLEEINKFYQNFDHVTQLCSHSVCFCCLRELPEHPLPCGHVLCTPCVQAFGSSISKNVWSLDHCPLHQRNHLGSDVRILIKPHFAGVRILTLDGGGMRGLVELLILAAIEREIDALPIQDFFDLIVGTSTGGIIALGLGVKQWRVQDCILKFKEFCDEAFTRRRLSSFRLLENLSILTHNAKYKTKPIERGLKEYFGDENLFGGSFHGQRSSLKVAVTSTTEAAQAPLVLANYNRPQPPPSKIPYKFERPDDVNTEFKTWEAARATSAAPPYFKPFLNDRSQRSYLDGALYNNNPVEVADSERKLLWPDIEDTQPDLLLSVGAGRNVEAFAQEARFLDRNRFQMPRHPSDNESPRETPRMVLGLIKTPRLVKLVRDRMRNLINTQETWEQFERRPVPDKTRQIRLNPLLSRLPKLDETDKLANIEEEVKNILTTSEWRSTVIEVAYRLIASCFYFEKPSLPGTPDLKVVGTIKCRFEDEPHKVKQLGRRLEELRRGRFSPFFRVIENSGYDQMEEREVKTIALQDHILENMHWNGVFNSSPISVNCSSPRAETTIEMCFQRDTHHRYPISGFPRRFITEDESYDKREKQRRVELRAERNQNFGDSPERSDFGMRMNQNGELLRPDNATTSGLLNVRPDSSITDTSQTASTNTRTTPDNNEPLLPSPGPDVSTRQSSATTSPQSVTSMTPNDEGCLAVYDALESELPRRDQSADAIQEDYTWSQEVFELWDTSVKGIETNSYNSVSSPLGEEHPSDHANSVAVTNSSPSVKIDSDCDRILEPKVLDMTWGNDQTRTDSQGSLGSNGGNGNEPRRTELSIIIEEATDEATRIEYDMTPPGEDDEASPVEEPLPRKETPPTPQDDIFEGQPYAPYSCYNKDIPSSPQNYEPNRRYPTLRSLYVNGRPSKKLDHYGVP